MYLLLAEDTIFC